MCTETFMKIQQLDCENSYKLLTLWPDTSKMEMVYPLGSVNLPSKSPSLPNRVLYLLRTNDNIGLLEAPEEQKHLN